VITKQKDIEEEHRKKKQTLTTTKSRPRGYRAQGEMLKNKPTLRRSPKHHLMTSSHHDLTINNNTPTDHYNTTTKHCRKTTTTSCNALQPKDQTEQPTPSQGQVPQHRKRTLHPNLYKKPNNLKHDQNNTTLQPNQGHLEKLHIYNKGSSTKTQPICLKNSAFKKANPTRSISSLLPFSSHCLTKQSRKNQNQQQQSSHTLHSRTETLRPGSLHN